MISLRIKPGLATLVQIVSNLRAYLTKEARHRGDSLPQGDNLNSIEPERKDLHHVQSTRGILKAKYTKDCSGRFHQRA